MPNVQSNGNKFRAMLVPFGDYSTLQDDGKGNISLKEVGVEEKRAKHWISEFSKLKGLGYKFPVPWGHRVDAIPSEAIYLSQLTRENEGEFARHNASYIEKIDADKDGVWFEAEVPPGYKVKNGSLVNEKDGTRAADFSAGIGSFMDNKGEWHQDIILHAAIVPLAVCSNNHQVTTALSSNKNVKFSCTLSANQRSKSMKDEKEKETPAEESPEEVFDNEDVEAEAKDKDEPEVSAAPAEVESNVEMQSEGQGDDDFREVTKILRDMGLDVPQDLAEADGWKWLCTALRVAASMGAKFVKPNDEMDESKEFEKSTEQEPEVNAENPPVLMSSITDPMTKKLAQKEQDRMRNELKETWEKAQRLGCPSHIASRESAKTNTVFLSMNAKTGNFLTPSALSKAKLVTEILEKIKDSAATVLTDTLSTAHVNQPNEVVSSGASISTDKNDDSLERLERAMKRGAGR